jgi:hypothetical protein
LASSRYKVKTQLPTISLCTFLASSVYSRRFCLSFLLAYFRSLSFAILLLFRSIIKMLAQWTAVLALLATANASPVELKKRAFSLEQVERGQFLKNGPNEVVKTLRKYGATVPSHLLKAAEARANSAVFTSAANGTNGSAPAVPSDEYDSLYVSALILLYSLWIMANTTH